MQFWQSIDEARALVKDGDIDAAKQTVLKASELAEACTINKAKKLAFLEHFRSLYDLKAEVSAEEYKESKVKTEAGIELDQYVTQVGGGTSLVTCCMNRNENLVKALPSWIACSDINEIIIVDWSSDEPVFDYLKSHGIEDSRIKVIRVNNQPRWILSYAFNIGFRAASYNKILKTDADIVVYPEFFANNILNKNTFIAGDWRIAEPGQEHINGFFYVHRDDLMKIKGFNEYITTYGWDDDDIYHRLTESGTRRKAVDVKTIYHIPHDDSLRVGASGPTEIRDFLAELHSTPRFKIHTNRHIAHIMPVWNKDRIFLPFKVQDIENGLITLQQTGESIHYVPTHIRSQAEYLAELELTSWVAGLRTFDLTPQKLSKVLKSKPQHLINILDVEIALHNDENVYEYMSNYVAIYIHPDRVKKEPKNISLFLKKLADKLQALNCGLIVQSDALRDVSLVLPKTSNTYFVPGWRNIGQKVEVSFADLSIETVLEHKGCIAIQPSSVDFSDLSSQIFGAKGLHPDCNKFFVDAQHGLGNRLRAIGSAAAIAKETGKELVIVWEPDHHCECRFSDLFDYEGEVIEKSFLEQAKKDGDVFNYMEIEDGAEKDKPIVVKPTKYVYARAAYTFVHEASHWEAENEFIKALKPSKQVLDLIAPFNVNGHIAAHIRMEAGAGLDHNTYDSVENWTQEGHDQLHFWREKSHYSAFIKRIDKLIEEDSSLKLFVATDLQETYDIFEQYYGDRLVYLKRHVFDRSKEQIIYALADVLLLSKCKKLLGSTWSSFSEAAMRLSNTYSEIEMSGRDF